MREQRFLVLEERYDDGSTFRCQWPEASIEEYVHVTHAITGIAAERGISPHEAYLLVMHAKFPELPEPEYVRQHVCPGECADWLAGRTQAASLFIPHQCPTSWEFVIEPA
ncbi:hypothetical protein [Streptomyces olivaceus]|uniref:hypothetical protein n=1 Tax=Streptomyces olivaceus TaxID=47716 RepID=UPI0040568DFC